MPFKVADIDDRCGDTDMGMHIPGTAVTPEGTGSVTDPGRRRLLTAMGGLALSGLSGGAHALLQPRPYLVVDSERRQLHVMRAGREILKLGNTKFGQRGVGFKKQRGDQVTPVGVYQVAWIKENSRFHRFFGLDYPDIAHAQRGLDAGLIDQYTYSRIYYARRAGMLPPQDTPLGGAIGIHGVGIADLDIHSRFDWTEGCVALRDEQVDSLGRWLDTGTIVVIR